MEQEEVNSKMRFIELLLIIFGILTGLKQPSTYNTFAPFVLFLLSVIVYYAFISNRLSLSMPALIVSATFFYSLGTLIELYAGEKVPLIGWLGIIPFAYFLFMALLDRKTLINFNIGVRDIVNMKMFDINDLNKRAQRIKLLEVLLLIGGIVGGTNRYPTMGRDLGVFIIFALLYYLVLTDSRFLTVLKKNNKTFNFFTFIFAGATAIGFSAIVTGLLIEINLSSLILASIAVVSILLIFTFLSLLVLYALYAE